MSEPTLAVVIERLDNMDERNREDHARIEAQTMKTNGSVANLKLWRAYLTGGLAVVTAIVIPVAIALVLNWVEK